MCGRFFPIPSVETRRIRTLVKTLFREIELKSIRRNSLLLNYAPKIDILFSENGEPLGGRKLEFWLWNAIDGDYKKNGVAPPAPPRGVAPHHEAENSKRLGC